MGLEIRNTANRKKASALRSTSRYTRWFLLVAAICMVYSLYLPYWQVQLSAPQYPEGLVLKIFAGRIDGDVEIINGLNHYIGMKTLDSKNFPEFQILPSIIGGFAFMLAIASFFKSRKIIFTLVGTYLFFGILSLYDFWRWEYHYGHDLNPDAAIIVPGMAYQPPLLGFKQLLNFGAYSIPDYGSWVFITAAICTTLPLFIKKKVSESPITNDGKSTINILFPISFSFLIMGCTPHPVPIQVGKDACAYCKMNLSDLKFSCEMVTEKGRVYLFDDLCCLVNYLRENKIDPGKSSFYISDFSNPLSLCRSSSAVYLNSENIRGPMGGSLCGFGNLDSAKFYRTKLGGSLSEWNAIIK